MDGGVMPCSGWQKSSKEGAVLGEPWALQEAACDGLSSRNQGCVSLPCAKPAAPFPGPGERPAAVRA